MRLKMFYDFSAINISLLRCSKIIKVSFLINQTNQDKIFLSVSLTCIFGFVNFITVNPIDQLKILVVVFCTKSFLT